MRGSDARRTTSPRGRTARLLRGAAPPTPPSRTSALRGSWPTHPPSDFLSVGAAPPRPPPDRQPPAPSPLAGEGGGEGVRRPPDDQPSRAHRASPAGGCAPHTPIPDERAARLVARPPTLGCSFCGGCAPTPPPGLAAPPAPSPLAGEGGGEGERAQPATGASACGGTPQPTRHNPPPGNAAPRRPEWIVEGGCGGEPPLETTAPSPLAGEGGGEGVRRPPDGKPSRAPRASPAGAAPPHPIPDERAARLVAHPPTLGFSLCGAAPPRPHPDRRRSPGGGSRTPFRHSGESRNPSGASEGVRRPPADKPQRAHRAPLSVIPAKVSVIPAKAGIHPGHRRGSGARRPTNPRGRTAPPFPSFRRKPESIRGIGGGPQPAGQAPRRRNTHQAGSQAGAPPHPHPLPQERGPAQERHQKTRRTPPRPLQTEVARTASGPPPLTRGHPRALLHMCRVSPLGRSASHGAPRHGAGGKQASSGTGRRDGVCGVQLERRRKRVSQAPPRQRKPRTRRAIGQDHSERNNATSTSMKEGQNLSYVTRIGAYGFAVVAAFAVALAVLLSCDLDPGRGEGDRGRRAVRRLRFPPYQDQVNAQPGVHGAWCRVAMEPWSSSRSPRSRTATGSWAANSGQSIGLYRRCRRSSQ